jgi:hypothetical protein
MLCVGLKQKLQRSALQQERFIYTMRSRLRRDFCIFIYGITLVEAWQTPIKSEARI